MKLFSAAQDFEERTLAVFAGPLRKMLYILGLRRSGGDFFHWGLERSYGIDDARAALRSSYEQLRREVLRSDLQTLVEEKICGEELPFTALSPDDLRDAHLKLIFECLVEMKCPGSKQAA